MRMVKLRRIIPAAGPDVHARYLLPDDTVVVTQANDLRHPIQFHSPGKVSTIC